MSAKSLELESKLQIELRRHIAGRRIRMTYASVKLDQSQLVFVESPAQNIRLLAPAGCGKTQCLLHRCRHLAAGAKTKPRFLIVTFTVAARDQLVDRLKTDPAFATIIDQTHITTLNAFGYARIRNQVTSHRLISKKDDMHFTFLNQLRPVWIKHPHIQAVMEGKQKGQMPQRLLALMNELKSLGFDHERHTTQEKFLSRLAEIRAQGLELKVEELIQDLTKADIIALKTTRKGDEVAQASDRELYSKFFIFWREAVQMLFDQSTFSLEDQKYYTYLDEQSKIDKGQFLSGAARYDHVLVDEFQDINPLDLSLIRAIADRNRASLTIVGDDDQAIYEWRGATPDYILNPAEYLQRNFQTAILETNYRSPKNVVEMSRTLIEHNSRRELKQMRAHRTDEAQIDTVRLESLPEALEYVDRLIRQAIADDASPARVAIIGRKKSQIIPYQIYLASKEISFCAAEDLQIFLSSAFDQLLELLQIRGRATMRKIPKEVIAELLTLCALVKRYKLSKAEHGALQAHLSQARPTTLADGLATLRTFSGPLKGANANNAQSEHFAQVIQNFLESNTVTDALMALATGFEGLHTDLAKAEDDIFFADAPIAQLAEYASVYGSDFDQFLDHIDMAKNQLIYVSPFEDDDIPSNQLEMHRRPVQLMTAPRAKGKEFDTVILLDVNDGIWPSRYAKTPAQMEAERRMFYVAFTRARSRIVMLVSERYGRKGAGESRYLAELQGDLVLSGPYAG